MSLNRSALCPLCSPFPLCHLCPLSPTSPVAHPPVSGACFKSDLRWNQKSQVQKYLTLVTGLLFPITLYASRNIYITLIHASKILCIIDTCIGDICIMDIPIMTTWIMDICIMDTCITDGWGMDMIEFWKCKSIPRLCSVKCKLNHTVQMVLVDHCDSTYKYVQNCLNSEFPQRRVGKHDDICNIQYQRSSIGEKTTTFYAKYTLHINIAREAINN